MPMPAAGSPRDAAKGIFRGTAGKTNSRHGQNGSACDQTIAHTTKKAMRRHFVLECVYKQRLLPVALGKGGRLRPKNFVKRIFKQFTLRPKGTIIFSAKLTARVKCHV